MSRLRKACVSGLLLVSALIMTACASSGLAPRPGGSPSPFASIFQTDLSARQPGGPGAGAGQGGSAGSGGRAEAIYLGSGAGHGGSNQSVSTYEPGDPVGPGEASAPGGGSAPGDFSLNFENADLKEVVQSILGNALKVNYSVDPTVSGSVTISSARPVAQDDLLPILEMVLQMNGAALMRDGELYRIVPEASAVSQWGDVGDARPGYGISILPLRYVSAQTLISLIDGFGTRPGSVRAETARNLLIVLGNSADREAAIAGMYAVPQGPLFDAYGVTLLYVGPYERDGAGRACPIAGPYPATGDPSFPGAGWEEVFASGEARVFRRAGEE